MTILIYKNIDNHCFFCKNTKINLFFCEFKQKTIFLQCNILDMENKRDSNIELLRIVAMFLVLMTHAICVVGPSFEDRY